MTGVSFDQFVQTRTAVEDIRRWIPYLRSAGEVEVSGKRSGKGFTFSYLESVLSNIARPLIAEYVIGDDIVTMEKQVQPLMRYIQACGFKASNTGYDVAALTEDKGWVELGLEKLRTELTELSRRKGKRGVRTCGDRLFELWSESPMEVFDLKVSSERWKPEPREGLPKDLSEVFRKSYLELGTTKYKTITSEDLSNLDEWTQEFVIAARRKDGLPDLKAPEGKPARAGKQGIDRKWADRFVPSESGMTYRFDEQGVTMTLEEWVRVYAVSVEVVTGGPKSRPVYRAFAVDGTHQHISKSTFDKAVAAGCPVRHW